MRFAIAIFAVAVVTGPAFAADIDIHDAIDIAANKCPVNNGETDSPLRWHAERRGDVWHAWFGSGPAKLIQLEVNAQTGATTECVMSAEMHPVQGTAPVADRAAAIAIGKRACAWPETNFPANWDAARERDVWHVTWHDGAPPRFQTGVTVDVNAADGTAGECIVSMH